LEEGAIELKTHPVWEKQPGEPRVWHERFIRYFVANDGPRLGVKPGKRLLNAYNQFKAEKYISKNPPKIATFEEIPQEWKEASTRYRWIERGNACDERRSELDFVEAGDRIKKFANVSVESVETAHETTIAFFDKLSDWLTLIDTDSLVLMSEFSKILDRSTRALDRAMDMRAKAIGIDKIVGQMNDGDG
jgi:hypothetical protein